MGIFDTMLEKVRGKKEQPKKRRDDINLPDESADKPVGLLAFNQKSKDKLKQSYRDKLRNNGEPLDTQQELQSRIIFGGDPDDPRWDEHNKRVKGLFPASKK